MFEFNSIIHADVIDGLKQIPNNSVTLVLTSPPYNLKIDYGSAADDQPYTEYVKWLKNVFTECYRVLRKGGRLIINIDAMTNRQDDKQNEYVRDIRTDLANDLKPMGFKFFGEHVWYKSSKDPSFNGGQFNGKKTAWGSYMSCSTPAVRRNHEYILVYSKEQFKLEKAEDSGAPDITDKEFQTYIASVWSMQPETRNLGDHPVPFPVELPYRCIKLYSYVNDVILDPFNGTGTTCVIAAKTGRRYIGIDMDATYVEYARNRIAEAESRLV
jgi:DNA modification methylase